MSTLQIKTEIPLPEWKILPGLKQNLREASPEKLHNFRGGRQYSEGRDIEDEA